MIRLCSRCRTEVEGVPASLPQCEDTELPAIKFACPKCETVEWIATGDPWRPTLFANLPPPPVGV